MTDAEKHLMHELEAHFGKGAINKALRALDGRFATLRENPYAKLKLALHRFGPSRPPAELGLRPYELWVNEVVGTAYAAATALGEMEDVDAPPRDMIEVRPIYSAFLSVEEIVFDWEPIPGAESYAVWLIDTVSKQKYPISSAYPGMNYPIDELSTLEPGCQYNLRVQGLNHKGEIVGVRLGTFWLLREEERKELEFRRDKLRSTGEEEEFWEAGLLAQFKLYDVALQKFIALTQMPDANKRVAGYMGAINLWQTLYRELTTVGYVQAAYSAKEEAMRLQAALRNLLNT